MGPARLPKSLVAKLNAVTNQVLQAPDVWEQLLRQGADPIGGTPEDFAAVIARDIDRWKKVIAAAGLKPE
jgi:tripartite-type tricarboxylate transporter receptor subunit TctC